MYFAIPDWTFVVKYACAFSHFVYMTGTLLIKTLFTLLETWREFDLVTLFSCLMGDYPIFQYLELEFVNNMMKWYYQRLTPRFENYGLCPYLKVSVEGTTLPHNLLTDVINVAFCCHFKINMSVSIFFPFGDLTGRNCFRCSFLRTNKED